MSFQIIQHLNSVSRYLPESDAKKLLVYVAVAQTLLQKYQTSKYSEVLDGLLPSLVGNTAPPSVKEAAFVLDQTIPWELVHQNPNLHADLHCIWHGIERAACATPEWLKQQVDALFHYAPSPQSGIVLTPPSLRQLIAALAALSPFKNIYELCSGTALLGLELWRSLGNCCRISYQGIEMDSYLCALSKLLLFLTKGCNFVVENRDALSFSLNSEDLSPAVYIADLPLVGSYTLPVDKNDSLAGKLTSLYSDWAFIRTVWKQMRSGERAFFVVTNGALVRRNEAFLRQELVLHGQVEAVIALPPLYPSHLLPMNVLVLKKEPEPAQSCRILFADLNHSPDQLGSRSAGLTDGSISNICKAICALRQGETVPGSVPPETIQAAGFSLNPLLYLAAVPERQSVRLGDLASVTRGVQLAKNQPITPGPCYLLNVRDIQDSQIHYETADRIGHGTATWEQKYRIREDDIILTSKGASLKVVIVPPSPPVAYISGNLTIIRVDPRRCHPYVIYEYLASAAGQSALSLIQTGTTIRVLGVEALKKLTVPACDAPLMQRIGVELKSITLAYTAEQERLAREYRQRKRDLLARLDNPEQEISPIC